VGTFSAQNYLGIKKMKRISLIAVLFLAACAQQPENIAAVDVAGDPYRGYSCQQLKAEHLKISQELEVASADQKKAASNDALGVFLLGLPLASMSGNDKEATIAIAKGRVQELDKKMVAKRCK
jgi:hypothetical protein